MTTVAKLAATTAEKFKKNKLIPSSSTQHVLALGSAASTYATELKSLAEEFATFDAYKKKLAEQIAGQKKLIGPNIAKLYAGIDATLKNPTRDEWLKSMKQNCRSIGNGVKVVPEWSAVYWNTWEKNDGERFWTALKGTPDEAGKIKTEVLRIKGDLDKLKAGLKI